MPFRLGQTPDGHLTLVCWDVLVSLATIKRQLRGIVVTQTGEDQPISAAYLDGDGLHIHILGSNHLTVPWDDGDNSAN